MDSLAFYFSTNDDCVLSSSHEDRNTRRKDGKHPRPTSMLVPNAQGVYSTSAESSDIHASLRPDLSAASYLSQNRILGKSRVRNSKSFCCLSNVMPQHLPPEKEMGNIEYKRKLVNPTPNRFEHLVTQMKWRLNEGGGQAIYRLGVDDDGRVSGLEPMELAHSLATLHRMAKRLNATVHPLRERTVDVTANDPDPNNERIHESRKAVELLVRQSPSDNQGKPSICIAVLGGVDAGKSTLIGVLTDGELDNARGRARLNLFRHLHEVQSGRTSSLSSELLGFDASGSVTNYTRTDGRLYRATAEEVARKSTEVVTLLDLAGHSKYQRTTLAGLARGQPVGVLLCVSATSGLTSVSLEHAQLAHSLGLPMAIVVTKIDQLRHGADRTRHVTGICRQLQLRLSQVQTEPRLDSDRPDDVAGQSHDGQDVNEVANRWLDGARGSPLLFPVSAVTGEGVDRLTCFLGSLGRSSRRTSLTAAIRGSSPEHAQLLSNREECHSPVAEPTDCQPMAAETEFRNQVAHQLLPTKEASVRSTMRFWISEVFTCVPGVQDPVVFGSLKSGQLRDNHLAWLGPDSGGYFHLVRIVSLKHNRQPHQAVYAGQTASVAVRFMATDYRFVPPSSPMPNGASPLDDELFQFDNDENCPGTTETASTVPGDQTAQPIPIRRGMVLVSHLSWSNPCASLGHTVPRIPLKLPHVTGPDCSVAVAWTVELELCQRLSLFAGFDGCGSPVVLPPLPLHNQRVTVYAGCVAQTAIVLSEKQNQRLPSMKELASTHVRLFVRFARHPEYLEVGRRCILSWAGYAKAVGRVISLHDTAPTESAESDSTTCFIQPDGRLDRIVSSSISIQKEESTGSPLHTGPDGPVLSFLSEPDYVNNGSPRKALGLLSTSLTGRPSHWPTDLEHWSPTSSANSTGSVPAPFVSLDPASGAVKPQPHPLATVKEHDVDEPDSSPAPPNESNADLVISPDVVPDEGRKSPSGGRPPTQRRKRRRKRRG